MEYYSFMSSMVPLSELIGLIYRVLIPGILFVLFYGLGHYVRKVIRGRG